MTHERDPSKSFRSRAAELGLAVVLLLRAANAMVLSMWLMSATPGWRELFHGIAVYAVSDGLLGFVATGLVAASRFRGGPAVLTLATFGDAFVRAALGVTLLLVPTVAELPMTAVSLFGAVGGCAAVLGIAGIVSWAVAHHRRRGRSFAYEALFDPIPVIALVSIAAGAWLVVTSPATAAQLRLLVTTAGVVIAAGFATAGLASAATALRPGRGGPEG